MEVTRNTFLPVDPRLTDSIVYELKSRGIFDNFRKECISDVDTKPAYQNLRQRVEGSVSGFLKSQQWSPNMNKNQVREMLRKTISESGFLETGVERIVDQVVNPKINSVLFPQVENIVYKFLGINKPSENNSNNVSVHTSNITVAVGDLLPKDLEAISPDIDTGVKVHDVIISSDFGKVDENKIDDEESPPFEAIEETTLFPPPEESSTESHLSGISGITNHDSHSFGLTKAIAKEEPFQNDATIKIFEGTTKPESSHNSRDSIDSLQHIQVSDPIKNNMDINEDSNYSRSTSDIMGSGSNTFDNILAQEVTLKSDAVINCNSSETESINNIDKLKVSDSKHQSGDDKYKFDKQHTSSSSRDHTSEKDKKLDSYKSDSKYKSKHSSRSSYNNEKEVRDSKNSSKKSHSNSREKEHSRSSSKRHDISDREKDDRDVKHNTKRRDTESHKDKKSDKHHSRSKHSNSHHSRDKSAKSSISENSLQKSDVKATESPTSKYPSKKDDNYFHNDERNNKEVNEKGSFRKSDSKTLSKDKDANNKASSKQDDFNYVSKERKTEKFDSKKYSSDSKHSRDHSHHKSSSESRSDSRSNHSSRDKGDYRMHSKVDDKTKSDYTSRRSSHRHEDKHHSRTSKHSSSSKRGKHEKDRKQLNKDDHHVSKEKKYHRRSTDRDSSDGRSGTYSSSSSFGDTYSSSQLQKAKDESSKINSGSNSGGDSGNSDQIQDNQNVVENAVANFQQVKLIKPKFASNIFEARKLLKIRKKISKLEKQNQMTLNNSVHLNASISASDTAKEKVEHQESDKSIEFVPTENSLKKTNSSNSIKENEENESNNDLQPLLKVNGSKKNVNKFKTVLHSNISKKHENHENLLTTSLPVEISNEEKAIYSEKSPSPLQTSVISKESWDAIEAKVNSANILKVDYNSYVDTSEDIDDDCILPHEIKDIAADVKLVSSNEVANIAQEENQSNISNFKEMNENLKSTEERIDPQCSQSKPSSSFDEKAEVPKETIKVGEKNTNCLYLVPEVLPETQSYFDKIAHKIALLEEEIARRTNLLVLNMENQKRREAEVEINKRLPKVDIVDVNTDNEIAIVPNKSAKCEIKNHQPIVRNNKRKLEFTEVDASIQTTNVHISEKITTTARAKKSKIVHNSIGDFSLPLSPADSEHSISSNSEKQKPNIKTSARRASARQQSYTNDDLYKPRLRFTSTRRRLAANAASDKKN